MARAPREQSRLREFALIGARARLEALQREEDVLRQQFPELFRGSRRTVADGSQPVRRQRRMSPAQRKAVSERMRKYWAERRKKSA